MRVVGFLSYKNPLKNQEIKCLASNSSKPANSNFSCVYAYYNSFENNYQQLPWTVKIIF
jgi:hypothetical protein